MYKTIGILGGMGPAATTDLMEKIIQMTDAKDDQHHLHLCVDCNTNIADRTAAILEHGKDPVPEMVKSAVRLGDMGADFLIIPCNTAHYFIPQIQPFTDIPIISMLDETAGYLHKEGVQRVGLLATDGTIQSGVYAKALASQGIDVICPNDSDQQVVMSLIYDKIKKGIWNPSLFPKADITKMLQEMRERGAEKFILGCTELPLAFQMMDIHRDCVDPTRILAHAAIVYAGATPLPAHDDPLSMRTA